MGPPEASIEECLARMEQKQVRRVVVIDNDGRCVGIVAQADPARLLPREKAGELVRDVSRPGT
jgi:CBS domain-containing protein